MTPPGGTNRSLIRDILAAVACVGHVDRPETLDRSERGGNWVRGVMWWENQPCRSITPSRRDHVGLLAHT